MPDYIIRQRDRDQPRPNLWGRRRGQNFGLWPRGLNITGAACDVNWARTILRIQYTVKTTRNFYVPPVLCIEGDHVRKLRWYI